jgi:hypothetical protein
MTVAADADGPLIRMPALTPDALRRAVAQITPGALPAFTEHLSEAATQAQQLGSLGPLRAFNDRWALHIAIERHPRRAARLHELERLVESGAAGADSAAAVAETGRIIDAARAEFTT